MTKESFTHSGTSQLLKLLDQAARSGVSRGQAFEDFLHMAVCALSGGAMEDQYLNVVERHKAGESGRRGCDALAQLFAALTEAMETTRADIVGDLFQGAVTRGEAGQFYTPEPVCELMAAMTVGQEENDGTPRIVSDPCCGSGRLLLAATEGRPHWHAVDQDIDLRCVRMTTINLALRNRFGHVIHGDTLRNERKLVYQTGYNGQAFVAEFPIESCPAPVQKAAEEPVPLRPMAPAERPFAHGPQLRLF
jgi:hypothetical protein